MARARFLLQRTTKKRARLPKGRIGRVSSVTRQCSGRLSLFGGLLRGGCSATSGGGLLAALHRLDLLLFGLDVALDATLLETRRLADAVAQVVKLRATNDGRTKNLDLRDTGAVKREFTLDALTRDDAADGERFTDAGTAARDDVAVKDLDTLFVAFENLAMHVNAIADFKMGNVFFLGASFHQTNKFLTHGNIPLFKFKFQLRSALRTSDITRRTKKKN